jgi:hypothetical protein
MNWPKEILDWSEVWAPLIPLTIYFIKKPRANWVIPILIYLLFAIFFSVWIDFTWKSVDLGIDTWCKKYLWWLYRYHNKEQWLYNTIFYNLFSLVRVAIFSWFFIRINSHYKKFYTITLLLFILFYVINFGLFQDIMVFSSRVLAFDAGILLGFCLSYFYKINLDDNIASPIALSQSWVVTGLTLYTAVNFFIFFFYSYITEASSVYAKNIWNVHNFSYIMLEILIAISFWKAKKIK